MKVTRVCCQGCGADLDIDESIRFATCNFCGARLEIVHDSTVTHTRLLEEIGRQTDEMAGDLKAIRLQNDIERLDREWAMQRETLLRTDQNGERREPSAVGGVAGGVFAIIAGLVWIMFVSSMGAPAIFPLFGLLFIGVGVAGMIRTTSAADRYRRSHDHFQRRRAQLEHELGLHRDP